MLVYLGELELHYRQVERMASLHSENIISFSSEGNSFYVMTKNGLSEKERSEVIQSLRNLPKTPLEWETEDIEFSLSPFKGKNQREVEQWINSNVTDLASVKQVLRQLSKAVVYLINKRGMN